MFRSEILRQLRPGEHLAWPRRMDALKVGANRFLPRDGPLRSCLRLDARGVDSGISAGDHRRVLTLHRLASPPEL